MNFNEAEIKVLENGFIHCKFADIETTIPNDTINSDYIAYLAWKENK